MLQSNSANDTFKELLASNNKHKRTLTEVYYIALILNEDGKCCHNERNTKSKGVTSNRIDCTK